MTLFDRSHTKESKFDLDSEKDSLLEEDINMYSVQYIIEKQAKGASETHNRLASDIRLGDEILN